MYDFDRSPACPGRLCLSARGGLFVIYLEREEGNEIDTRLPDEDSQILRLYVFGPSGFWTTMAPLRYAAKFDPFLSLDCARVEGVEGKERRGSHFA